MSQQVRFAPSSLDVCYVRNGHVTVNRADGSEVPIWNGHHCSWLDDRYVVACPPEDGTVWQADIASLRDVGRLVITEFKPPVPAGNTLTAASGKVAVHRTDPRRVLTSFLTHPIDGATDPVLSADGEGMAYLYPDQPQPGMSALMVEYGDMAVRAITGHPLRHRFSHTGTSLCWEEAGGQIFGIADVANPSSPVVRLSRPEDSLWHPVPCWHALRGTLYVMAVQARGGDTGRIFLMEWGSCVAGQPMGCFVGDSGGSGFDMDVFASDEMRFAAFACFLSPTGTLVRSSLDLDHPAAIPLPPTPPVVVPPEPDPERWTLVPDGTLVTDAIVTLVGANPVQQDGIICLHKNTFPECEWRRVFLNEFHNAWLLSHWADASRFPGDRGWWIEPDPTWCADVFQSGWSYSTENATLVDFHHGTTNRWRQTNTLYGIVGGGVMVQFDPRFPGQYTDMSLQGTDQWAPAGYEKQWTRHDGWSRWDYIVTPLTAKGVIPWGDPSMDVVIQTVESAPTTPGAPLPFVPCPRPLTATPKPPEPPSEGDMTHDDIRRYVGALDDPLLFGALQRYHNEVLPRDRPKDSIITSGADTEMWTGDVTTGGANGYFVRAYISEYLIARDKGRTAAQASGDGYDAAFRAYTSVVNPPVTPPVQPGTLHGPVTVSGRDFEVQG